ncbi:uncharacterized protein LOC122648633 [Telopea speciosissima]|uniref:uncharacterized protein LOC122648633 n=1 Tax=Telopea speciosissima TaxID=54955 RepID=UPI001CC4D952|nr:uncharacterized protein LOC122648633 [Telopea speciosissima]XP_043697780.1 uncharacterized protein LOC122648633 [Telopea speciosissima]
MSLALIQGYSSAEEEEEPFQDLNSSDEEEDKVSRSRYSDDNGLFDLPKKSGDSLLPSAFEAFSEVAGPPEFLNNSVADYVSTEDINPRGKHGGRAAFGREKKDLPAGAVMESKAQLVGIRERVRSDVEGNLPPASSAQPHKGSVSTTLGEGKRVMTATNPDMKDASDLLRMCLQCGIPKTYSNTRGIVCPVCGDRPPVDPNQVPEKKKGSTVKDKEKSKRMKGQSTHSAWKSETEMQLRQQFD